MKYIDRNVVLDFAGTSCEDVFNCPRKVSLFTDVILQNLHRERHNFPTLFKCHAEASSRVLRCSEDKELAPDADQSQEANLFVEELLVC